MIDSILARVESAAIQGTLFAVFVWLLCLLLRGLPAKWKCWLWRLVPVKLLIALLFVLSVPVIVRPQSLASNPATRLTSAVTEALASPAQAPRPQPRVIGHAERQFSSTGQSGVNTEALIFAIWALGTVLVFSRDLLAWIRVKRIIAGMEVAQLSEAPAGAEQIIGRTGYWVPLRVRKAPGLEAPAIIGLFEPTVLLPTDYQDSSLAALSSALAHELGHMKRRDLVWILFAEAMKAVFWFNPLVWIACREQRIEAEIAADQLARMWTDYSPKEYARNLLEWIERPRSDELPVRSVPGILLSTHELTRRMKAMTFSRYSRFGILALGAILVAPLALGLAPLRLIKTENDGLAASSWPKFRGGLTNSGFAPVAGAIGKAQWTFRASKGVDSSVSIGANGTIYFGSWDGRLYALDSATGTKKWTAGTDSSVQSSPAIGADGTVYVGSWDGFVYAFDGATGDPKWSFKTGDGVYSSPTIGSDGTVYIGSEDGKFYALDGTTGAKKWELATNNIICSCAAIGSDGTVYFGANDHCLYAVDPVTGKPRWAFNTGGEVVSSPAIGADGTIYVGTWKNAIYAINPDHGNRKWVHHTGGPVKGSPAVGPDGTVFVASFDHNVYALDGSTGVKKWAFTGGDGFNSSPAVTRDNTVYISCWDHKLYALDGGTGKQKWTFKAADTMGSSPTVGADGTIYFGCNSGTVYALK